MSNRCVYRINVEINNYELDAVQNRFIADRIVKIAAECSVCINVAVVVQPLLLLLASALQRDGGVVAAGGPESGESRTGV